MVKKESSVIICFMEFPGRDEQMRRPEFESYSRELIFDYARDHEAWLQITRSKYELSNSLERLSEMLELRIIEYFGSAPEISVSAGDVNYSEPAIRQNLTYMIEARPLSHEKDAPLHDRHLLQGRFQGFHIGQDNELRVYVATDDRIDKLAAGIYIPYQSVRLRDAQITLTEHMASQRLQQIDDYILTHLEEIGEAGAERIYLLKKVLSSSDLGNAHKLNEASQLIVALEKFPDMPEHLLDNLIEMTLLKLRLDTPNDITASGYRKWVGDGSRGFVPMPGPITFERAVPSLEIVGDTSFRDLALILFHKGDGAVVPAKYVTRIDKSIQ